jgi:RHS repeat-associated protein
MVPTDPRAGGQTAGKPCTHQERIVSDGRIAAGLCFYSQYTSDAGQLYLRARSYEPATAQFLSRDPLTAVTGEPYAYAGDNPISAPRSGGQLL